jgi:uncharacterized protein (DUF2147 family)
VKTPIVFITLVLSVFYAQSQTIMGKWKTIDDATKQPKAIVEIYEKSGKLYGKITSILNPDEQDKLCVKCTGVQKNQPIMGLLILKATPDGADTAAGEILDPNNGKNYSCNLTLESKNILKIRAYIGLSIIGRTQYWQRIKN